MIPGYNDTKIRTPGLAIPRHDGATYAAGWDAATAAGADWALITSWNEWHEGTEIEASEELGDRALAATRAHIERFQSGSGKSGTVAPSSREWRSFAANWNGGTVGLLGGTGVPTAGAPLALSGLPFRVVGLRNLCNGEVTARDCPILVYVGGETIRSDFGTRWTLPEALSRFARDGGVLIVASPEAWPFYRDVSSGRTAWSPAIGLPLQQGFERPPVEGLWFAFQGALDEFHTRPYPNTGELRFRPCVPTMEEADRFEPLATLKGPDGQDLGAAIATLVYPEGPHAGIRILYVAAPVWNAVEPGQLLRALLQHAVAMTNSG